MCPGILCMHRPCYCDTGNEFFNRPNQCCWVFFFVVEKKSTAPNEKLLHTKPTNCFYLESRGSRLTRRLHLRECLQRRCHCPVASSRRLHRVVSMAAAWRPTVLVLSIFILECGGGGRAEDFAAASPALKPNRKSMFHINPC